MKNRLARVATISLQENATPPKTTCKGTGKKGIGKKPSGTPKAKCGPSKTAPKALSKTAKDKKDDKDPPKATKKDKKDDKKDDKDGKDASGDSKPKGKAWLSKKIVYSRGWQTAAISQTRLVLQDTFSQLVCSFLPELNLG